MDEGYERFGAAITALHAELDWCRLGASYCEGDGRQFFDDDLRERMLETGFTIADAIGSAVASDGARRSLYLGAAVAELVPILAEHFVLRREVVWLNMPCDEMTELTRALRAVEKELGIKLPKPSSDSLQTCAPAKFDHLWMVSVLTDPDAFPALHDALYERSGGPLATGRGSLSDERVRADVLIECWLACAADDVLITTTDEELTLIEPAVHRRGGAWSVSNSGHETSIVGDNLRLCRWSR